ncbi:MAG TPA: FAD-dependent oxidoreductase [Planctomycetota bacterium]|jgi:NADPH-dependent 2,4-dienoyl-CoA reductase/sulfur reductase-like enzyme/nitrite reductase/ring-hydroxylating ferredoxin subunit
MEQRVASIHDLQDGQMKQVKVGELPLLLARVGGEYYAVSARCPHYGGPLAEGALHQCRVTCPWHHSVFDLGTGNLLEPPALDAIARFDVRVDGEGVFVTVPEGATGKREMPMCARAAADARLFAIIGGGAAASTAVETLRQEGFAGRIVMISAEDRLPYDRPNCSKDYLAGTAKAEWMALRSESFYEQHGIERFHKRVISLDVPARKIVFEDGSNLSPDAILVATGGRARQLNVPGSQLPGVYTLRSWDDTDALIGAIQSATNIAVIGGSFIAMEVAASLQHRGAHVTVVAPERVPFERTLGAQIGTVFLHLHEQHGVEFRLGHSVRRFSGTPHLNAVELDDGSMLKADVAVVGAGVTLATEFISGIQLNQDGSLDVDEHLLVADGVYAAGDIARYPDPYGAGRVRIEHWRLAQQHGRAAAKAMAGHGEPFTGVPFFWTRQYELSLGYVGHATQWDETIACGDLGQNDFTVFYVKDGRLLAAAGTQDAELAAFSELMRTGQLPAPDYVRNKSAAELMKLLHAPVTSPT